MPIADLTNARIAYQFDGPSSAPVLVLSNSLGADLSMWDAQTSVLSSQFRVLRYDTRGHGTSSVPDQPFSIGALATDLLDLLDHLGLEKVSFCGLSMGGLTGMWLGAHAASRLHRLVLSNTAAKIGSQETWSERIARVHAGGLNSIVDDVMQRWFTPDIFSDPRRLQAPRQMFLRTSQAGYLACCEAIQSADYRGLIPAITVPTLVIAGREDRVTTPGDAAFLEQAIPGAACVVVPGAHLANIEFPVDYNAVLTGFLNQ